MSTYNHVTLVGILEKDPIKKMVGKKAKTTFTLGVEVYKGKNTPQEINYFDIVLWGKLAEIAGEYLRAGKKVLVDGKLSVRHYDKDNTPESRRWITEVVAENIKFLPAPATA